MVFNDLLGLLDCPFCGCKMRVESNRDWHKLYGDHDEYCIFNATEPVSAVPAHYAQMSAMIRDWNRRAEPNV